VVIETSAARSGTAIASPPITVWLFAGASDLAGARRALLPAEYPLTIEEAFRLLCGSFPRLAEMEGRLLFAANAEYAGLDFVLHAGDELALIPPVSGGAGS
jgi:molybdopterin synthase catalytic subunit